MKNSNMVLIWRKAQQMNKKLLAIILVIAILIPIVVTTVVLIRNNSQNEPPVNTETNEDTEKDTNKETEKNEPVIVPAFTGKTDLSEERAYLLEVGLLTQMERTEKGNPKTDESGSYLTDESGAIIYESNCSFDYSNVPKNLHVLINYFADKEYSETAIRQIQRFYFYFCESLGKLELFDMLNKIEKCFSTDGTSPELLTQKTKEVFGMENDSGFPYVFKDSKPADEIEICVNDVKPYGEIKKCDGVCVFNALNSGVEYDRNLQSWLHKITNELTNQGYGEKELVIAQLLFYGSLREVEYRANIVEDIMKCIPSDYEITIDELDAKVREVFSVSILENLSLTDYMKGLSAYEMEVCN